MKLSDLKRGMRVIVSRSMQKHGRVRGKRDGFWEVKLDNQRPLFLIRFNGDTKICPE